MGINVFQFCFFKHVQLQSMCIIFQLQSADSKLEQVLEEQSSVPVVWIQN